MSERISLTPVLEQQILASIRSGGYPHIAAAAWGVPEPLWEKWRRWGTGKNKKNTYKRFFFEVEKAHAQARLKAELAAHAEDPRSWLKHGPGKERADQPGWTALARPSAKPSESADDLFASPAFLQLLATLRAVLAPYPEALAAVSQALAETPSAPPCS